VTDLVTMLPSVACRGEVLPSNANLRPNYAVFGLFFGEARAVPHPTPITAVSQRL